MRYYIIAGEASGDLHAAHLMHAIRLQDHAADFRFVGGDMMAAEGGTMARHYRTLAYMGFIPVMTHLRTIMRGMAEAKADIRAWQPDVLVLVDYPGFNLAVAKHIHRHTGTPIAYYIPPKIWAWKEHRLATIRRCVDRTFTILPFETPYYAARGYEVEYVGNPTREEVESFIATYRETREAFAARHGLDPARPIIAILAGSRRQEIGDNLARMLRAAAQFPHCQAVVAGAPGLDAAVYAPHMAGTAARLIFGQTYALLSHAQAALVTSGTATLETAILGVPQVVCYHLRGGRLMKLLKRLFIHVPHVSLVNLIAGRTVVPELIADDANPRRIADELAAIIDDTAPARHAMLDGYADVMLSLGTAHAADGAARGITALARDGRTRPASTAKA